MLPTGEIRERLQSRERGETAVSDARQEDFEMLSARYEALTSEEAHIIMESRTSVEETVAKLLKMLAAV